MTSLELLFSSYSVNWPHNVYYSSPGHDDTYKNRSKAYNLSSTLLVHSL